MVSVVFAVRGAYHLPEEVVLRVASLKGIPIWPQTLSRNFTVYWLKPDRHVDSMSLKEYWDAPDIFRPQELLRHDRELVQAVLEYNDTHPHTPFGVLDKPNSPYRIKYKSEIDCEYENVEFMSDKGWVFP